MHPMNKMILLISHVAFKPGSMQSSKCYNSPFWLQPASVLVLMLSKMQISCDCSIVTNKIVNWL